MMHLFSSSDLSVFSLQDAARCHCILLTAYVVGEDDYCSKNEKVMVWLARFKHVDVVDSAVNLDKLRGIGFHLDEIRGMVGYPLLNTEFSTERALTKNYGGEGSNNAAQET